MSLTDISPAAEANSFLAEALASIERAFYWVVEDEFPARRLEEAIADIKDARDLLDELEVRDRIAA